MDFLNRRLNQTGRIICKLKDNWNDTRREKRQLNTEKRVMDPYKDKRLRIGQKQYLKR